jgi:hypothetical protein
MSRLFYLLATMVALAAVNTPRDRMPGSLNGATAVTDHEFGFAST